MIRISKLTDYAIVLLCQMARSGPGVHATSTLAEQTGLAMPTVAKLLKSLVKAGIVGSSRGVNGGYTLASSPSALTIASIINALEGPIALTECSASAAENCQQSGSCDVRANWHVINDAVRSALNAVTLQDMLNPADPGAQEHIMYFSQPARSTLQSPRSH